MQLQSFATGARQNCFIFLEIMGIFIKQPFDFDGSSGLLRLEICALYLKLLNFCCLTKQFL